MLYKLSRWYGSTNRSPSPLVSNNLTLKPYRLEVSLVENRRNHGKVRQEHVANLGSIRPQSTKLGDVAELFNHRWYIR